MPQNHSYDISHQVVNVANRQWKGIAKTTLFPCITLTLTLLSIIPQVTKILPAFVLLEEIVLPTKVKEEMGKISQTLPILVRTVGHWCSSLHGSLQLSWAAVPVPSRFLFPIAVGPTSGLKCLHSAPMCCSHELNSFRVTPLNGNLAGPQCIRPPFRYMPSEIAVAPFQGDCDEKAPSPLRLPARISYYEILSRMLSPERKNTIRSLPDSVSAEVIVRDFAYSRMAAARNNSSNITSANAKTFAEYV